MQIQVIVSRGKAIESVAEIAVACRAVERRIVAAFEYALGSLYRLPSLKERIAGELCGGIVVLDGAPARIEEQDAFTCLRAFTGSKKGYKKIIT